MPSCTRLLALAALVVAASAAAVDIVAPASNPVPSAADSSAGDLNRTSTTDAATIVSTANIVDQKRGAAGSAPPDQPVSPTVVTAVDGQLTQAGTASASRRSLHKWTAHGLPPHDGGLSKRFSDRYVQVFAGTGTDPHARDAAIEGTAYLTYTLVNNATYNVDDCLAFCDRIQQCVFANLYYEFNNQLLDFVFSQKSNLKCVLYGDVHTAAEKTNTGGQQSEAPPAPLTYIQNSSGYSSRGVVNPPDPEGYSLVYGPTNGSNNAPGYMGFAFIDKYDVNACAQLCNARGPDPTGGECKFFNIWRAVVKGAPATYTCSMYYLETDASTAVNFGQGDLKVSLSRGYARKNLVVDPGFEGYTACRDFCFTASYANWIGTSPPGGNFDASIFYNPSYAYAGHGAALLGSATAHDSLPGTLAPAKPLVATVAGKRYSISFYQSSLFSGREREASAFVDVLWNGEVVMTIRPGYTAFKFFSVQVTARGNDRLAFHGGAAPAWSFIDNVAVYAL